MYLFAHDESEKKHALSLLKKAFEDGDRTRGWDFGPTLQRATQDAHPNLNYCLI